MNFAEYFDRICIINLPERIDRKNRVLKQIHQNGLDMFPGKVKVFPAIKPADADGFASRALRGCFMSHLAVLRGALEDGLRNILIVEDDLVLSPKLCMVENQITEELFTKPWDFLYLGHMVPATNAPTDVLEAHNGPVLLAHFYAVNARILKRLVEEFEQVLVRPPGHPHGSRISPDGALSLFRHRNPETVTLLARPSLGSQGGSRSDISPRWFDRLPLVRGAVGILRTLKAASAT